MFTPSTPTHPMFQPWAIDDDVIRVRAWGTEQSFPLFSDDREARTIGTGSRCWLRVQDVQRRVSRQHAHLERARGQWYIVDDRSKHGVFVDGVRCERAPLVPCAEIGLGGGVTLIAESARSITLRNGLARLLGWAPWNAMKIDLGLRALRHAASRRSILVLCGEQELVPLAVELHRLTLTEARPFVLCNPLRSTSETPETPVLCVNSGLEALAAAPGGTVCLYQRRLPSDLIPLLRDLRVPECQTQLVVCSPSAEESAIFNPTPLVIPPISSRAGDLDRLIDEYLNEAAAVLGMEELRLNAGERAWLRECSSGSLADIARATLRLGAIHQAGSISGAGRRVGISHTAMLKWLKKRQFSRSLLGLSTKDDD